MELLPSPVVQNISFLGSEQSNGRTGFRFVHLRLRERCIRQSNPKLLSADQSETTLLPFIGNGLMELSEGDKVHRYVKERFVSQLGALGAQVIVVAIHQNCYSSFLAKSWAQAFHFTHGQHRRKAAAIPPP
ncbi:hypothetical protein NL676_028794 [Syzygium grande]|nr:hypothetical protein NL676_028794 [Syzygium grande]